MREEAQRIAGRLEGTLRVPDAAPTAIVVIAHPLPTHGGSMRNPLMAALARGMAERGWYALRFNFRGVGASEGEWSGGLEEPADLADAVAHARALAPGLPLGLLGFSFGAVTALRWLASGGRPDSYALLGFPLRPVTESSRDLPPMPRGAIVVNGEHDEFGTAEEIRRAFPEARVFEVKGADHYFTGKRDEVVRVVADNMALP
jgi:alpha/beta superfamily hydrolase